MEQKRNEVFGGDAVQMTDFKKIKINKPGLKKKKKKRSLRNQ